jgi:DNA-binding MarR family transcriptional regulator
MAYLQPERGIVVEELLLKCHQLEKELAAAAELSVDEFHCLTQLYALAPCCVKKLSEVLRTSPSRTSRLLHHLEERGYLTRSFGFADKRMEMLALTNDGMAAARHVLQSSAFSVNQLANSLPEEVAKLFATSLGCDDQQATD